MRRSCQRPSTSLGTNEVGLFGWGVSRTLAVVAAMFTAAPAMGAPVAGLAWLRICTEHGVALLPMPKQNPVEREAGTACHVLCTLPRKSEGKRP